jgi:hypothetical protein
MSANVAAGLDAKPARNYLLDDIDMCILPFAERSGALNSDALFSFQLHRVHLGCETTSYRRYVSKSTTTEQSHRLQWPDHI